LREAVAADSTAIRFRESVPHDAALVELALRMLDWMGRTWLAFVLAAACGDNLEPPDDPLALATLVDTNPDPAIVEVELVATVGRFEYVAGAPTEIWAYRDGAVTGSRPTIPGPLLDVNQGDQVIVHLRNELPEPTTIHWHGIRVPNAMDGSEHTQDLVQPGATFDYVFTAVDAGTYWYHPHIRSVVQLEKGLYAPMIVRGGVEPSVHADRTFVLDDVKLADDVLSGPRCRRRSTRASRLERHRDHPALLAGTVRGAIRRTRALDVSLPHPRASGARDDGRAHARAVNVRPSREKNGRGLEDPSRIPVDEIGSRRSDANDRSITLHEAVPGHGAGHRRVRGRRAGCSKRTTRAINECPCDPSSPCSCSC